ncbi:unnamed protein product [Paramecium sonneborni]|uniref:Uncharacterized protein n=1 Tax=Paramecium sonneborni TaxID=65129 RepID=A0A8S1QI20_9CILI|nr:unnamed protein product [Paramecium sonneborni]
MIQLNSNKQDFDMYQSPIIYNKQKNVIIIRHKFNIYIIRELNDGKFKIVKQLKFNTNKVYGTITNDGSYLVSLNDQDKLYSIDELIYK